MQFGKPRRKILSNTILRLTGAKAREVLVGPSFGVDVSVIGVSGGNVMVANCDPISLIPELGTGESAVMSVHEVASDVATSGHPPRYAMFDLNLPPKTSDRTLAEYWKSASRECRKMGVSIIGGHTGRFEGCDYSIVGSATMWSFCRKNDFLTSGMATDEDDLILTKSAAFGATAVLAKAFSRKVRRTVGPSLYEEAVSYLDALSTVEDSLAAVQVGTHDRGITAIHNLSEGGVLAGAFEMGAASGMGCNINMEDIPISDATTQIMKLFHIDPMTSLGEGSLLLACKSSQTRRLIARLKARKVPAAVIGSLSSKFRGVKSSRSRTITSLDYPSRDPYWSAYSKASRKGWR